MSSQLSPNKIGAWLRPAAALMQRLRMPVKLATMSLLLIVPLVAVTIAQVNRLTQDYRTAQKEALGAQAVSLVTGIVTEVQHHRVESMLSTQPEFEKSRAATNTALGASLVKMDAMVNEQPVLQLSSVWNSLRGELQGLVAAGTNGEVPVARYAKLVQDLRKLSAYAAETSTLVLDPKGDTYFLQAVMAEHTIPWLETISSMRAFAAIWMGQTGDKASFNQNLGILAEQLDRRTDAMTEHFDAFLRTKTGDLPKDALVATDAARGFAKAALERLGQEPDAKAIASLFEIGGKAIESARTVQEQVAEMLIGRLHARQKAALSEAIALGGLAAVGILLMLYLVLGFSAATMNSINILHLALQEGTKGNLATHVEVPGKDEIAQISLEFEAMLKVLSSLVADVRSASSMVTHVGGQLVEDGHSLSQRTQSQAVSLEEAASNVGHVSDTVARNSEAAQEVSLMTQSLRTEADHASTLMTAAVSGMAGLQATSERMREIIGTIDGIAFQTNLLALNAAVEAARAGEQGKGFAVVAAEVRSLARRSQSAAAEVRSLIADSSTKVSATVTEIESVGRLMGSLVTGISEIAQNIETMADGSAKQSIALAEVVQAVGDLDKVTIENSGLVDRTSHRSARLMQRSRQLENAVTYIKLRQGTADEALDITTRAHALVQSAGLEAASDIFHDPNGGFVDRDLYVFVFDRQGIYRVIGVDRKRVGSSLFDTPGVDAQQLVDDAWHRCEQGGGWVEYNIINPATGDVRGKSSYVLPLNNELLIGCGAYRGALTDSDEMIGR